MINEPNNHPLYNVGSVYVFKYGAFLYSYKATIAARERAFQQGLESNLYIITDITFNKVGWDHHYTLLNTVDGDVCVYKESSLQSAIVLGYINFFC